MSLGAKTTRKALLKGSFGSKNARKVLLKGSFGAKNARECSGGCLKEMKSVLISLTRPSDVFVEEGPLVTKQVRIPFSDKSYVGGEACFEAMKFADPSACINPH